MTYHVSSGTLNATHSLFSLTLFHSPPQTPPISLLFALPCHFILSTGASPPEPAVRNLGEPCKPSRSWIWGNVTFTNNLVHMWAKKQLWSQRLLKMDFPWDSNTGTNTNYTFHANNQDVNSTGVARCIMCTKIGTAQTAKNTMQAIPLLKVGWPA